jgi:predicted esterase
MTHKVPDPGIFNPSLVWLVLGVGAAVLFGWKAWQSDNTRAEPIAVLRIHSKDGGLRNEPIVRSDCVREKDRVWVMTDEATECIAYVVAKAEAASEIGVVFFDGDVKEEGLEREMTAEVRGGYGRKAAELARNTGLTTIVVGRPGLMGSTGFHQTGGMAEDAHTMSAALDSLKQTFGFKRLALAGQSGGARLIAQLMALGRDDIRCAAMGSGAYGLPGLKGGGTVRTNIWGAAGKRYAIPLKEADRVVQNRDRRAFVIGDPSDKISDFAEQRAWAEKLVALNHHAVLVTGRASDPDNHGLASAALAAAALCANGRPDAEVVAAIGAAK